MCEQKWEQVKQICLYIDHKMFRKFRDVSSSYFVNLIQGNSICLVSRYILSSAIVTTSACPQLLEFRLFFVFNN